MRPLGRGWKVLETMNRPRSGLLLAGVVLGSLAAINASRARPQPAIPAGQFRLAVDEVVADKTLVVKRLTVTAAGSPFDSLAYPALPVSLRTDDGRQTLLATADSKDAPCSADVLVVGDLMERPAGPSEIKVLLRVKGHDGGHAGGSSRFQVPQKTMGEVVAVNIERGTYPLDTPLTIGTLQGKPITLVVGKTAQP